MTDINQWRKLIIDGYTVGEAYRMASNGESLFTPYRHHQDAMTPAEKAAMYIQAGCPDINEGQLRGD